LPGFLADLLARLTPSRSKERTVQEAVAMVDEVLDSLGVGGQREESEEGEEGEEGFDWSVQVGSAILEIGIHANEILGETTIEVRSPILRLPAENLLAFYRRCLELNRIVVGCCIGVDQDVMIVAAERRVQDVGRNDFVQMLLNVASAADQFDDELAQEFGARRLGDP
jgi:hypothetical protein